MSIILYLKRDPQQYNKEFFNVAAYKKTYMSPIFPLDFTNVNGDAIRSLPNTVLPITAMLLQNLKMTLFFLLPLVALLEGPKGTDSW